jgi:hypothetical protein
MARPDVKYGPDAAAHAVGRLSRRPVLPGAARLLKRPSTQVDGRRARTMYTEAVAHPAQPNEKQNRQEFLLLFFKRKAFSSVLF